MPKAWAWPPESRFDRAGNLYVGDRSGTIFKIGRDRQIFVFAMIEPSVAAYHLAFGNGGNLYVTGPTTSSFDAIHQIDPHGEVSVFYRGLGRPQGLAADVEGNLYVAASLNGRRGIVKVTPDARRRWPSRGKIWLDWPLRPAAQQYWQPPAACITSPGISRAGRCCPTRSVVWH